MGYVKKRKPRIFNFIILFLGIGLVISGITFGVKAIISGGYPKEMMQVADTNKDFGKHKKQRSKDDFNYYVLHYPNTKVKELDQWIETEMKNTVNAYGEAALKEDETRTQIKQDYQSKKINDQYVAVQLDTYKDNVLISKDARVFDINSNSFVNGSIFKPLAQRQLTQWVRNNINQPLTQDLIRKLVVNSNTEALYMDETNLYFLFENEAIAYQFGDNPNYFNETFANINPSNDDIPSTYLDYGYEATDKMVAFTFDDGPHGDHAFEIMDIFEKYNGQVTFFILGHRIPTRESVVKAVLDQGHQIASHSYDHPNFENLSIDEIKYQLDTTEALVKDATGYDEPLFVRPPYGAISSSQLQQMTIPFINWDVDTQDWQLTNPKSICEIALRDIQDGSIVLMHELYSESVESLDCIVSELDKQGYQFVTVKELFKAKGVEAKPGAIYYYVD